MPVYATTSMGARRVMPSSVPGASARSRSLRPYIRLSPRPWRRIEPQFDRAVVIPWLSTAAAWQELRYSLRSIHVHFQDSACPIFVIGDMTPDWLIDGTRVRFIELTQYRESKHAGMWEAWQVGTQIAREVLWSNDDIYFLRSTGWEDLRTAFSCGSIDESASGLRSSGNGWRVALGEAVEALHANGVRDVHNMASHTPYLFEIDKTREIFDSYHLPYSGAFETLYHNNHGTPRTSVDPIRTLSLPCPGSPRFLNHYDHGPDAATKAELERLFSTPAPWEKA